MDRFTTLTVFARVVANGSFAGAARQLNMSPAAVSTHIQALEARLGTRLLNRTTRSLALTEVGQVFYERSAHILAELEETERLADELQKAPRGLLRVNMTPSFGDLHVAAAAADFTARYPDISVELIATSRFVDLVEEGFDLAVRTEPPPESSLIARRIAPVRLVVCGAPDYVDKRGLPQRPEDLTAHNCLRLSELSFRDEWCLTGPDGKEAWIPRRPEVGSPRAGFARICAGRRRDPRDVSAQPPSLGESADIHRFPDRSLRQRSGLGRLAIPRARARRGETPTLRGGLTPPTVRRRRCHAPRRWHRRLPDLPDRRRARFSCCAQKPAEDRASQMSAMPS